jgi:hypothetical protein
MEEAFPARLQHPDKALCCTDYSLAWSVIPANFVEIGYASIGLTRQLMNGYLFYRIDIKFILKRPGCFFNVIFGGNPARRWCRDCQGRFDACIFLSGFFLVGRFVFLSHLSSSLEGTGLAFRRAGWVEHLAGTVSERVCGFAGAVSLPRGLGGRGPVSGGLRSGLSGGVPAPWAAGFGLSGHSNIQF